MNLTARATAFLVVVLTIGTAHGAGGVIGVSVMGGKLIVGNGILDNAGYAERLFFEDDAEGFPVSTSVSGFGPSFVWTVPGLNINGMAENSGLYLQSIARPVKDANPPKQRVLWHWSASSQTIVDAPSANHFLTYKGANAPITLPRDTFLTGTTATAPVALKIAAPLANEMGSDNFGGFVRFALHRQTAPPAGAYGFFAQLQSDQYLPSEPFLVLFNVGQLSATQMTTAALAINAAASDSLAGDFNTDGIVNAADYTVWRDGLGSIYNLGHYTVWKNNFGDSQGSGGGGIAEVPEPATIWLVTSISISVVASFSFRCRAATSYPRSR